MSEPTRKLGNMFGLCACWAISIQTDERHLAARYPVRIIHPCVNWTKDGFSESSNPDRVLCWEDCDDLKANVTLRCLLFQKKLYFKKLGAQAAAASAVSVWDCKRRSQLGGSIRWHLSDTPLFYALTVKTPKAFATRRQHAAVNLSPYGSERAHQLLSASDHVPPTPSSGSDMGLRCTCFSKTAADGEYSGCRGLCDGHLWGPTERRLLVCCPRISRRFLDVTCRKRVDEQQQLNPRCDVIDVHP